MDYFLAVMLIALVIGIVFTVIPFLCSMVWEALNWIYEVCIKYK